MFLPLTFYTLDHFFLIRFKMDGDICVVLGTEWYIHVLARWLVDSARSRGLLDTCQKLMSVSHVFGEIRRLLARLV
jgi:hypothetical protein